MYAEQTSLQVGKHTITVMSKLADRCKHICQVKERKIHFWWKPFQKQTFLFSTRGHVIVHTQGRVKKAKIYLSYYVHGPKEENVCAILPEVYEVGNTLDEIDYALGIVIAQIPRAEKSVRIELKSAETKYCFARIWLKKICEMACTRIRGLYFYDYYHEGGKLATFSWRQCFLTFKILQYFTLDSRIF